MNCLVCFIFKIPGYLDYCQENQENNFLPSYFELRLQFSVRYTLIMSTGSLVILLIPQKSVLLQIHVCCLTTTSYREQQNEHEHCEHSIIF